MLLLEHQQDSLEMMQQGNGGDAKKGSMSVVGKTRPARKKAVRSSRKYATMKKEQANMLASAISRSKKTKKSTPMTKAKAKKTSKKDRDAQLRAERDARNAIRFGSQIAKNNAINSKRAEQKANEGSKIMNAKTGSFVQSQNAKARHKGNS